jgi:hypothetical protein
MRLDFPTTKPKPFCSRESRFQGHYGFLEQAVLMKGYFGKPGTIIRFNQPFSIKIDEIGMQSEET